MPRDEIVIYSRLRTPRAAAVAGIVFSVLLVVIEACVAEPLPTSGSADADGFQVSKWQTPVPTDQAVSLSGVILILKWRSGSMAPHQIAC